MRRTLTGLTLAVLVTGCTSPTPAPTPEPADETAAQVAEPEPGAPEPPPAAPEPAPEPEPAAAPAPAPAEPSRPRAAVAESGAADAETPPTPPKPRAATPPRKAKPAIRFVYLRTERFRCGDATQAVKVYRFEPFARALGLANDATDPACEFVRLPAAAFRMGSDDRDPDERPAHSVRVGPLLAARTEVTQQVWRAVMGTDPAAAKGDRLPVEQVSWKDVRGFLAKTRLRLPSEAEWEYACRGGSPAHYAFGDDPAGLDAHGWYRLNAEGGPHPVAQKLPNAFGLFDTHGNVWEWCQDRMHLGYEGAPADGSAWVSESRTPGRVIRGGSWRQQAENCRSAIRFGSSRGMETDRDPDLGFRPVLGLKK